jgi:hypothetical protein
MIVSPAQAAAPAITINATTKLPSVARATGDALVIFDGGSYARATIHGRITGATKGEVAALYAQEFPFKAPAARIASVTLKITGNTTYLFTVAPVLATRYKVRVFASSTAKSALAVSATKYVYVGHGAYFTGSNSCPRPKCFITSHGFIFVPSTALHTEMTKHVYTYFAVNLSPSGVPPAPKFVFLNGGNPHVTVKLIDAGEYEITVNWSFTIGNDGAHWQLNYCQQDAISKDGLGLPGHHGCGDNRLPATVPYLG